MALAGRLEDQ